MHKRFSRSPPPVAKSVFYTRLEKHFQNDSILIVCCKLMWRRRPCQSYCNV